MNGLCVANKELERMWKKNLFYPNICWCCSG